jgi:hypothetical protein
MWPWISINDVERAVPASLAPPIPKSLRVPGSVVNYSPAMY